jgi:SEFIR domain
LQEDIALEATKIFISYSWDSETHNQEVLSLANTLRDKWGIHAEIDEYVRAEPPYTPEQGWDQWMLQMIEWAEFVLIVCTETYKRRFEGDEKPGVGLGVSWEGRIIMQELYQSQSKSTKFIPVVFSPFDIAHIPTVLKSNDRYVLSDRDSFKSLCYRLKKQRTVNKPPVRSVELDSSPEPKYFSPKPRRFDSSLNNRRGSSPSFSNVSDEANETASIDHQAVSRNLAGFARQRLEKRRTTLQSEWDTRNDKLARLRSDLAIETIADRKFQLEKKVEDEQEQMERLENELGTIEQTLQGDVL